MPNNYSTIGILVDDEQAFVELAMRVAAGGDQFAGRGGSYARSQPAKGQLWAQVAAEGTLVGLVPHFEGRGRVALRLTSRVRRESDSPLDGSFYGWVVDDGEETVPLLFDCPDAGVHDRLELPADREVQLAAFAHELEAFPDDAAHAASQAGHPALAAESWIASGLFEGQPQDGPPATAVFTGHVVEAALLNGPDAPFWWLLVRTIPGTVDVVCDPQVLEGSPRPGGVVSGAFWLSGRLLGAARETRRGRRTWGRGWLGG